MLTGLLFRLLLAWLPAAQTLAAGPTIYPPQVQQCDGTFQAGSTTRKVSPRIRVPIQALDGLRVGQQPAAYRSGSGFGIWRFNGSYSLSQETDCSTVGNSPWDDASITDAPFTVGPGGDAVYAGGKIYALAGNGSVSFATYSVAGNVWGSAADAPWTISAGGSLVYPGSGDFIYALRGGFSSAFARYSISANTWDDGAVADAPWSVILGGNLVYPGSGDYLYAWRSWIINVNLFARYSISGNSWDDAGAADQPWFLGGGSALASPGSGDFIYGLRGASSSQTARYSISGNSWDDAAMADPIEAWQIGTGGDMVSTGTPTYLYVLRGNNTDSFARYSIPANTWDDTNVTNPPWNIGSAGGASLVYPGSGDYIYLLRGDNTATFARYAIEGDVPAIRKRVSSWVINYTETDPAGLGPATVTFARCTYSSSTDTVGCPSGIPSMVLDPAVPEYPTITPLPAAAPFACEVSTKDMKAREPWSGAFPAGRGPTFGGGLFSLSGGRKAVIESTSTLVMPGSYSISAWIQTGDNADQVILGQVSGSQYWGFGVSGNSLEHFDSRETVGNQEVARASGTLDLTDNNWHHVAVVRWNGGTRRYFIDGVAIGAAPASNANPFNTPFGTDAYIGSRNGSSEFFNGTIDELRLWKIPMTDDEVAMEYNSTLHRYSTDGSTYTYFFRNAAETFNDAYTPSISSRTAALVYYEPQTINYSAAPSNQFVFMAQDYSGYWTSYYPHNVTVDRSPPSKPVLSGNPQSTNSIEWSWPVPGSFCVPPESASSYTLVNRATGEEIISVFHPTLSITESYGGEPPNQLHGRGLYAKDIHGTSPISDGATAYTQAAAPAFDGTAFDAATISSGSVLLKWLTSNNPSYTRYEVQQTLTAGWGGSVATLASINDNLTASQLGVGGLSAGTTYYGRIRAKNGRGTDDYGSHFTTYGTTDYTTLPAVPTLTAVALSTGSVRWDWSQVTGAFGYKLYSSTNGLMIDTPTLSYSSNTLSTNTAYGASVEAYGRYPLLSGGRSPTVYVFTLATSAISIAVTEVSTNEITVSWDSNGNPPGTYYEVVMATNSSFGRALSTQGVVGTSVEFVDLFPKTTYYFRVRTVGNGGGTTEWLPQTPLKAVTYPNPFLSVSSGPATPYMLQPGLVGAWHLDENAGTAAVDGSTTANNGALACLASACASTPTYTTGPPNMGTGLNFTGALDSLVRVTTHAAYDFTGDITVSAWVRLAALSQPNGAAIVAKGSGTAENFSLDIHSGKYRFMFSGNKTVSSTMAVTAGAWTHLTGVYSTAGTLKIYVNGVLSATTSGHGASRPSHNKPITIGSRQSSINGGTYDLAFAGTVDEVRIYSYAMTDDQVLSDYRAAFPAVVTPASNVPGVQLELPPNAFTTGQPTFFISPDPVGQPVRPGTSLIEVGLTVMPTGQRFIAGSLVEIVPIVDGVPYTGLLGSQATVYLSYPDADGDGVLDGTNPPVHASTLQAFVFEPSVLRWEPLTTTVDLPNGRVAARTSHFSIFGLFGGQTYGNSLAEVRVYPVPWQIRSGGKFDAANLVFDRLPTDGLIRIYSLAGEKIVEIGFGTSGQGRALWNGNNFVGQPVASGVYLAHVKSATDGAVRILKFVVER